MSSSDEKPHLDIDSHVVIQLGAELISDSEQALLELVKNAYDGDATKCTITIDPDWLPEKVHPWHSHLMKRGKKSIGRIVVEDNGIGLSENSVTKGWLRISASLKRAEDGNKKKTGLRRTPVGDKGLGRLATMRLGDVLLLHTRVHREAKARSVAFAWSDFRSGASLSDVPVRIGTSTALQGKPQGTSIEILGLNEPSYWGSDASVDSVITRLSSLISPFKRIHDFRVNIRYNERLHDLQEIGADALNHSSAKFVFSYSEKSLEITAWFSKTLFRGQSGEANREIYERFTSVKELPKAVKFISENRRVKEWRFKSLLDEPGGWLFSLSTSIDWDEIPKDHKSSGGIEPGPFDGEFYYVLFNEPTKDSLQAAGISVDILKEMTTVGVFRDGFRVRMNDDWLEISKSVTSGGYFQLRPRNVIGYFCISNELNSGLVEKSDREGFVDNEAWRGFMRVASRIKKLANDSLESVRLAYDDYKREFLREKGGSSTDSDQVLPSADDLQRGRARAAETFKNARVRGVGLQKRISAIRTAISRSVPKGGAVALSVEGDLKEIDESLAEFNLAIEEAAVRAVEGFGAAEYVMQAHEHLNERNLRLIDAAAVGLSARGLTHEINSHTLVVEKALASVRRIARAKGDSKLADAADKIAGAIRELKKTVSSINPLLGGSRSLKENFYVSEAVREYIATRSRRIEELDIALEISGARGPLIRFSRARFNQILENLLQNSFYWIRQHQEEDRKVKRQIKIEIDNLGLTWWDGAKGVRKAVENTLFEPYVTEKPEGEGQGLGLFLSTAFLESERCQISLLFERNSFGRRYKFRVDFRGAVTK